MKVFFYILFQLMSVIGMCQSFFQTKEDSIKVLCSKWQLIETKINDADPPFQPGGSQFISYKNDGTFLMTGAGVTINGKWKLDTKNNVLVTNDDEGNLNWRILKLTSSVLNLATKRDGEKIFMNLKRED